MVRHFRNQYRLSLLVGFNRREAVARALRTYFTGF